MTSATPFVYEAFVLSAALTGDHTVTVALNLPSVGVRKYHFYVRHASKKDVAYLACKTSREAFRDIAYYVFGEDFRWLEASMSKRDRKRNMFAIAPKILDAINDVYRVSGKRLV